MSNQGDKPDPYEAFRLEVERLRHENERFRSHLERWRTDVDPLYQAGEHSREMAFQFAQSAVKSMFLLNGGALIAFPAFAQLVGTVFSENIALFLLSAGSFVGGLTLIAIATVLAYKAMDADAEAIRQRQEVVKIDLNRSYDPKWYTGDVKKRRSEAEKAEERSARQFQRISGWALGLGVGSLVAFVSGAIFGALVLSTAASTNVI